MHALIDRLPNPLERKILRATKQIKGADRRIAVLGTDDECAKSLPRTANRNSFRFVPACSERADDRGKLAADYQVHRIAFAHPAAVGGCARIFLQLHAESRNIAFNELVNWIVMARMTQIVDV